ncbi:MAG TPA: diaminopimelate epimerase [Elusimicrobiota bacterium]|jgi:diaminopimelate epimerase|nr:diaminopimelate epimerase [Elusimicrobiota bacterium]
MTRFWKLSGAGNDFVLLEGDPAAKGWPALARRLCGRRDGIGSDGLLILSRRGRSGLPELRHFNGDGSAAFCGNGTRCAAWWLSKRAGKRGRFAMLSNGARVEAVPTARGARVSMPAPKGLRLGLSLSALGRRVIADAIDTGVPHAVVRVRGLERFPVVELGRALRRHPAFAPAGANVNFVEGRRVRTYERGVEDETSACGTGVTASALTLAARESLRSPIALEARGGRLSVSFRRSGEGGFSDVWLEGPARETFSGEVDL